MSDSKSLLTTRAMFLYALFFTLGIVLPALDIFIWVTRFSEWLQNNWLLIVPATAMPAIGVWGTVWKVFKARKEDAQRKQDLAMKTLELQAKDVQRRQDLEFKQLELKAKDEAEEKRKVYEEGTIEITAEHAPSCATRIDLYLLYTGLHTVTAERIYIQLKDNDKTLLIPPQCFVPYSHELPLSMKPTQKYKIGVNLPALFSSQAAKQYLSSPPFIARFTVETTLKKIYSSGYISIPLDSIYKPHPQQKTAINDYDVTAL